ncbi:hypothetical protein BT96DRAFT_951159, partial [Gymnopus androsaceus JB14]
ENYSGFPVTDNDANTFLGQHPEGDLFAEYTPRTADSDNSSSGSDSEHTATLATSSSNPTTSSSRTSLSRFPSISFFGRSSSATPSTTTRQPRSLPGSPRQSRPPSPQRAPRIVAPVIQIVPSNSNSSGITNSVSMSSVASTTALVFTMPVPGMADAPKFTGTRPSAFLKQILAHGARAGISDKDQLVDYIVLYSSDEVVSNIQYLLDFNLEEAGKTWAAAEARLLRMYKSSEEVPIVRLKDLETFCRLGAKEPKFTRKSELEKYYNSFLKVAGPLLKNKTISSTDSNYYFVQGLPMKDLKYLMRVLPAANRLRASPPTMDAAYDLLETKLGNKTSLNTHDWESDESADEGSLERLSNVKFSKESKKEDGPSISKKPILKKEEAKSSDLIETLTKEMQEIKASLANLNRKGPTRPSTPPNTPVDPSSPPARPCWMCGEWHDDPTIPAKCIHIQEFINEGIVVHQYNRRITQPDGQQLPRVQYGQKGGVAGILRAKQDSNVRDAPPYMTSSSPASLIYEGQDVFDGGVFGVASADICFNYDDPSDEESLYDMTDFIPFAAPTTRSGKDTSARHDPLSQKGRTNNKRGGPRSAPDVPPSGFSPPSLQKSPDTTPLQAPEAQEPSLEPNTVDHDELPPLQVGRNSKKSVSVPEPPHPINKNNGWRQSQPSKSKNPQSDKKPDVDMKDGTRRVPSSVPQYHFTSDLQQRVNSKKVFEKIIDTNITLTVGELLGCSPDLMKQTVDAAKTRREYAHREVSALYREEDEEVDHVVAGLEIPVEDAPRLKNFLVKYSSAVVAQDKLYAMVTGVFNVTINGLKFRAMINTGSELTIGSRGFFEKARLPLEIEGMKWSLKDVNGGVKPLMGVLTDTDIWIGKYNFPHHIFVSRGDLSDSWDIIIGQPFLQYYASRIEYWRSGDTRLFLWNNGDKNRIPHVSIALTDPKSERNQYVI